MQFLVGVLVLFMSWASLHAKNSGEQHLLAISQGISSPSSTSLINFSAGYTWDNPVGVIYQGELRASAHYGVQEDEAIGSAYGGEVGVSNGDYGFAVGYLTRDCDSCEGRFAGALGGDFGGFGLGVRFHENQYVLGFMFNPTGTHRLGLVVDHLDPDQDNNNITSLGVGYSYVGDQVTFSLDASKMEYEDPAQENDILLLTPGIAARFGWIAVSLSYHVILNEEDDSVSSDTTDIFWGLGIGTGETWHLALYGDYDDDLMLVGSLYF